MKKLLIYTLVSFLMMFYTTASHGQSVTKEAFDKTLLSEICSTPKQNTILLDCNSFELGLEKLFVKFDQVENHTEKNMIKISGTLSSAQGQEKVEGGSIYKAVRRKKKIILRSQIGTTDADGSFDLTIDKNCVLVIIYQSFFPVVYDLTLL